MSPRTAGLLIAVGAFRPAVGESPAEPRPVEPPAAVSAFLRTHCQDCHAGTAPEGSFAMDELRFDPLDPRGDHPWARILARVEAGEMPPAEGEPPPAAARANFLDAAGTWLTASITTRDATLGRVRGRRLSRRELERSLHALFGIDIPLASLMPEDGRPGGFTTVAARQTMSHHRLDRHVAVVDAALEEAFRRALAAPDVYRREFDAAAVARIDPASRCREPELLRGKAVVWANGTIYYGRLPATAAPADGWYRFRLRVSALNPPASGGVWSTVSTGLCVSSAPLLEFVTAFEAEPAAREIEFEAWLPSGHMLEIRPGDVTLEQAKFKGGQIGTGEGEPQQVPGIAIERLTMERVHHGPGDTSLRELVFGDVPLVESDGTGGLRPRPSVPEADLERLIAVVARRAYRRPVDATDVQGPVSLARKSLSDGAGFEQALRAGYRAVLCSPRFVHFGEPPGRLDDHAIATRLSYFLTGGPPDAELAALADAGGLRTAIGSQAERLLAGAGGDSFIRDFAAEWLDLDQIDFTEPDRKLFRRFDGIVKQSMLAETRAFLAEMLRENRPVSWLADSDVTYVDSRLARFYGIPDVTGDAVRRVTVSADSHRGGLLTHGAILKVTANGNTTSPVVRGGWVAERILGMELRPPPGGVPAIEPDIRGSRTIREQLARHRSDATCASCHRIIDPPGFALENYDPAGQWRSRYVAMRGGKDTGGPPVDAADVLADGRPFAGIDEFKRLVAADRAALARSVAGHLLVYGTGASLSFADRDAVEQIVEASGREGHGLRAIVLAVVASPVFVNK